MNSTRLIFTGDIGFDKYMDGKWKDKDLLSKEVLSFLRSGDHLCVNVEGPLMDAEKKEGLSGAEALKHSMPLDVGTYLNKLGADIWNICNNHIMDLGQEGLVSTLEESDKQNAFTLGAGRNIEEASKPIYCEGAGGIGMIAVGYQRACRKADDKTGGCFSWSDMDRIQSRILEVKSRCRWCIVVAHGGEEFTALPSPYTRDRYLEYLKMGADIVVGHHPHVPNNYELFRDYNNKIKKAIFYSLGNFIFDTDYQRSQYHTENGILLGINLDEEYMDFDAFGIRILRNKTENEISTIVQDELPLIFTDVPEKDYVLLAPINAKMFIENTKKQLRYMKPSEYKHATDEDFMKNFYEPLRSGRVPGEILDMQIIVPLAAEAEKGEWEKSGLESVKKYILDEYGK